MPCQDAAPKAGGDPKAAGERSWRQARQADDKDPGETKEDTGTEGWREAERRQERPDEGRWRRAHSRAAAEQANLHGGLPMAGDASASSRWGRRSEGRDEPGKTRRPERKKKTTGGDRYGQASMTLMTERVSRLAAEPGPRAIRSSGQRSVSSQPWFPPNGRLRQASQRLRAPRTFARPFRMKNATANSIRTASQGQRT